MAKYEVTEGDRSKKENFIMIRMSPELRLALRSRASTEECSAASLIRRYCREGLRRDRKKEAAAANQP